ncbi:hypothetical protein [Kiloniella sp. EL199]|uniref:hypothetical protein n=1 Tax=Kiloniella sp. EL199 TaxID=2107581 RepID=UPI000EA12B3F|nr:hypothetical protein [Kiloniella sp. EL199]
MALNLTKVLFAPSLIVAISSSIAKADMASGDEIRNLISGNTLQGAGVSGIYSEYYDPNGTLRGDGYSGKWKIEGDKGCMDYGSGFQCWSGLINNNASIWYLNGKPTAVGFMSSGNPNRY